MIKFDFLFEMMVEYVHWLIAAQSVPFLRHFVLSWPCPRADTFSPAILCSHSENDATDVLLRFDHDWKGKKLNFVSSL